VVALVALVALARRGAFVLEALAAGQVVLLALLARGLERGRRFVVADLGGLEVLPQLLLGAARAALGAGRGGGRAGGGRPRGGRGNCASSPGSLPPARGAGCRAGSGREGKNRSGSQSIGPSGAPWSPSVVRRSADSISRGRGSSGPSPLSFSSPFSLSAPRLR